jgi:hypothetical protein
MEISFQLRVQIMKLKKEHSTWKALQSFVCSNLKSHLPLGTDNLGHRWWTNSIFQATTKQITKDNVVNMILEFFGKAPGFFF